MANETGELGDRSMLLLAAQEGWLMLSSEPSSRRAMRRYAADLLQRLDVHPPLDIFDLCARLGNARGRPIELVPHTFPIPTIFGLWLGTATSDLILYERDASSSHQQLIQLHEVGHIVLDHGSDNEDDSVWRDLVPTIPPGTVRKALRRSAYASTIERDAEMFASVVWEWSSALDDLGTPPASQLDRAFGEHRGWL